MGKESEVCVFQEVGGVGVGDISLEAMAARYAEVSAVSGAWVRLQDKRECFQWGVVLVSGVSRRVLRETS